MSEQRRAGRPPYPPEVRERAVRMVFEHQGEYPSQWKAIESISAKLSINHETLRQWVRRAEVDAGARPGLTTDERARTRALERENRELRRANEILKAAQHIPTCRRTQHRRRSSLAYRTGARGPLSTGCPGWWMPRRSWRMLSASRAIAAHRHRGRLTPGITAQGSHCITPEVLEAVSVGGRHVGEREA